MARVRIFGTELTATPLREAHGGWYMRAEQHTSRTAVGTEFFVRRSEIVSMDGETVIKFGNPDASRGELEAAMAAERETLPKPAELIAKARKDGTVKNPKQDE